MKPLDELRSISDGCAYNEDDCRQWRSCREHRAQLLDAIEREIAERYMELPLDADGAPIHIGDVMEWASYDEDLRPAIRTVDAVGEQTFFAWNEEGGKYAQYEAHAYSHHQPDTWERIIRDAIKVGYADADNERLDGLTDSLIARCRALAGEGE